MRRIILLILFALGHFYSFSQSREIGLSAGISSYKGELVQSMFDTRFFRPAVGLFYRNAWTNHWAGFVGLNIGSIRGDDSKSNKEFNQNRDLHFKSKLWEASGRIEFNFFPYQTANPRTYGTPFLFIGLGVYRFEPMAELNGEWFKLRDQGTEGQGSAAFPDRKEYKLTQMSIPFGAGFKFRLAPRFGVTIDGGARRIFTDYLDDVSTTYVSKDILQSTNGNISAQLSDPTTPIFDTSNANRQRGNASDNDWYFFSQLSVSFTLSKKYHDNCAPFKGKFK